MKKKYKIFNKLLRESEKDSFSGVDEVEKDPIIMENFSGEKYSFMLVGGGTLGVQVQANGYHGGDAGHGARASLTLEDVGSYCFIDGSYDEETGGGRVKFTVGGDEECRLLISALRKSADSLEEIMNNYTEK